MMDLYMMIYMMIFMMIDVFVYLKKTGNTRNTLGIVLFN